MPSCRGKRTYVRRGRRRRGGRIARSERQLLAAFHNPWTRCGSFVYRSVHRPVESLWKDGSGGRVLRLATRLVACRRSHLSGDRLGFGRGGRARRFLGLGGRGGGRLLLGGLERGELFLGGQLVPCGGHRQLELRRHVLEDVDRDGVTADPLDRRHLELAPVNSDLLLLPEAVGDVRRRDRAEERAGGPGVDVESKLDRLEPLRDPARLVDRLRLVARTL